MLCKSTNAKNKLTNPTPHFPRTPGASGPRDGGGQSAPRTLPLVDVRGYPSCIFCPAFQWYFVATVNVTGRSLDFYSLVHVIWLIYLLHLQRRKAIAEVWPRYCGFLVSIMAFQYFLCLGLPPAFCKGEPNHLHTPGLCGVLANANFALMCWVSSGRAAGVLCLCSCSGEVLHRGPQGLTLGHRVLGDSQPPSMRTVRPPQG